MRKSIYLVEDNEDISELIQYILKDAAYDVTICSTAGKFRDQIQNILPDLVILDIMLPDGNGFDIYKEVKSNETTRNIPILMMSAHLNNRSLFEQSEAEDFISKPFDIDELKNKIQRLIA